MPRLMNIIPSNPQYQDDNKVNFTVSTVFDEPVAPNDFVMHVKMSDRVFEFEPVIVDPVESDPEQREGASSSAYGRYLRFNVEGLACNEELTFEIKHREDDEPLHETAQLKTPPAPNQKNHYRIVLGADQEILDLLRSCKLDDKAARLLKLNLDQSELTQIIYGNLMRENPDLFLHLGDMMHGEDDKTPVVTNLKDFEYHFEEDFLKIVGHTLQSTMFHWAADDHDLGKNNREAFSETNQHAYNNSTNLFNAACGGPTDPIDGNRGLIKRMRYGDLEFFTVNNRFFSQVDDSAPSLGEVQKAWLRDSLANSDAKLKFVISPLPFFMGKKPGEDYRQNWVEWNECMEMFERTPGFVGVFTADSHDYSRVTITRNGKTFTQILDGTLGGKPQVVSHDEQQSIPIPLYPVGLPAEERAKYAGTQVEAYYTPHRYPSKHGKLISYVPGLNKIAGDKNARAYADGKWQGKDVCSNAYGYTVLNIDVATKTMSIEKKLFTLKDHKKPLFSDKAVFALDQALSHLNTEQSDEEEVGVAASNAQSGNSKNMLPMYSERRRRASPVLPSTSTNTARSTRRSGLREIPRVHYKY